ncbi:helix-turn-helix transcriptional regulator [Pseudomonas putida]|nr:helix-turn-helix transcriptional regulator [Pseudomonas putida]EKT4513364.1 helix-turn-helix transcriptional regulator [Pseudomonas putida]
MLRRARELKAEDFAERIAPTHVANLENGSVSVSVETLEAVASVLSVQPVTLLTLAAGLRKGISHELVLREVKSEIEKLAAQRLLREFGQEFQDGRLKARPSGAQVSKERLTAVLGCKANGLTQKETALKLGIPTSTVQRYWQKSMT